MRGCVNRIQSSVDSQIVLTVSRFTFCIVWLTSIYSLNLIFGDGKTTTYENGDFWDGLFLGLPQPPQKILDELTVVIVTTL